MKKIIGFIVGLLLLTGCSNIAIVSSGSSLALSNNAYAKAYSGIDFATAITTKKDIKTHAYEYIVKAREVKKTFVNIVAPSVERKTSKVDESIKLASTKHERITITIDAFKLCYLSFFLATAITILVFVLLYLLIYLSKCIRKPIKVVKKRKSKRRKRK